MFRVILALASLLTSFESAFAAVPEPGCVSYYREIFQSMRDDFVPLNGGSRLIRTSSTRKNLIGEEIGRLLLSDHPEVQAVIDELAELGGELRLRITRVGSSGIEVSGRSHFRYDPEDGIPVISVDPGVDLDILDHEVQHFRDWKRERERLIRSGLEGASLENAVRTIFSTPEEIQKYERNAVGAQLRSQARRSRALSTRMPRRNSAIPSRVLPAVKLNDFISLITYPEREALLRILAQGQGSPRLIGGLMDEAVRKGMALRKAAHRRASENLKRMTENQVGPALLEQMEARVSQLLREDPLFDGMFNEWNMEDFNSYKLLLKQEFNRALLRRKQSQLERGVRRDSAGERSGRHRFGQ